MNRRSPYARSFQTRSGNRRLWPSPPLQVFCRPRIHLSLWGRDKRPPWAHQRYDLLRGVDRGYVATVSDDKMLMVWDLQPSSSPSRPHLSSEAPSRSPSPIDSPTASSRPQPTAYVIPFPHPLTSVSSHPLTSKEFLVSDCRGSVYLTDWRSDLEAMDDGLGNASLRHGNLVELVEPWAMSAAAMGQHVGPWGGSTAWRSDSVEWYVPHPSLILVRIALTLLCL
jgi:hypothetical protein